jgi:hypothetical protein
VVTEIEQTSVMIKVQEKPVLDCKLYQHLMQEDRYSIKQSTWNDYVHRSNNAGNNHKSICAVKMKKFTSLISFSKGSIS